MYEDIVDTQEGGLEHYMAPIHVYLITSRIYLNDSLDSTLTNTEETFTEHILTLSIYNGFGVPLRALIQALALSSQLNLANFQILYKTSKHPLYLFAGVFPHEIAYGFVEIESPQETIYVKLRVSCTATPMAIKKDDKSKVRRGNERRIGEVIDALVTWKRLVTFGKLSSEGQRVKCTKKEAADLVDIPKKTLADYTLQIKMASEYNFDFQLHCKEKFGVIREFNRRMKSR